MQSSGHVDDGADQAEPQTVGRPPSSRTTWAVRHAFQWTLRLCNTTQQKRRKRVSPVSRFLHFVKIDLRLWRVARCTRPYQADEPARRAKVIPGIAPHPLSNSLRHPWGQPKLSIDNGTRLSAAIRALRRATPARCRRRSRQRFHVSGTLGTADERAVRRERARDFSLKAPKIWSPAHYCSLLPCTVPFCPAGDRSHL
jgi:hypothetical protein